MAVSSGPGVDQQYFTLTQVDLLCDHRRLTLEDGNTTDEDEEKVWWFAECDHQRGNQGREAAARTAGVIGLFRYQLIREAADPDTRD